MKTAFRIQIKLRKTTTIQGRVIWHKKSRANRWFRVGIAEVELGLDSGHFEIVEYVNENELANTECEYALQIRLRRFRAKEIIITKIQALKVKNDVLLFRELLSLN